MSGQLIERGEGGAEGEKTHTHTYIYIYIYIYEKKAKAGAHDSQTMYLPSFSQGLLSLEDTVSALCLPETTIPLKSAYLSFLLHCILDTEVGSRHLLKEVSVLSHTEPRKYTLT